MFCLFCALRSSAGERLDHVVGGRHLCSRWSNENSYVEHLLSATACRLQHVKQRRPQWLPTSTRHHATGHQGQSPSPVTRLTRRCDFFSTSGSTLVCGPLALASWPRTGLSFPTDAGGVVPWLVAAEKMSSDNARMKITWITDACHAHMTSTHGHVKRSDERTTNPTSRAHNTLKNLAPILTHAHSPESRRATA